MASSPVYPLRVTLDDIYAGATLAERFHSQTEPTDILPSHLRGTPFEHPCLRWTGALTRSGYGVVNLTVQGRQRHIGAHRVALLLRDGWLTIRDGLHAQHECDNRWCVLAQHITLGPPGDNVRACVARGRFPSGEKMAWSKLTWDIVREIRRLHVQEQWAARALARRFGVHWGTIAEVLHRRIWREKGFLPGDFSCVCGKPHNTRGWGLSLMTPERKDEIVALYSAGEWTQAQLAERFGVSEGWIHLLCRARNVSPRKKWSKAHPHCVACGTTERRHFGHGLCQRCFARWWSATHEVDL